MKKKNLFLCLGAVATCSFGLIASLLHSNEVKEAKAVTDDKMFSVIIDLADAVGYTDFHYPEVHFYDSTGNTIDKYEPLHLLTGTFYTANCTFDSSVQTIDNVQFLFKQTNNEDKWSNSLALTPTANYAYHFKFLNTWTGANWDVQASGNGELRLQYYGSGENDITDWFTADVATKSYKCTVDIVEEGFDQTDLCQIFFGAWNYAVVRQDCIDKYLSNYSVNSFRFNEPGKYDIICHNTYEDGGVFSVLKYVVEDTYVYLVDVSSQTGVYTFGVGGIEQFGAFDDETRLGDIPGAQDVTGDLKFQNENVSIWYLPLKIGYPNADHIILINYNEYNVVGNQTANMLLVPGSAYWFSDNPDYHNDDAGLALDFLLEAEAIRTAVTASGSIQAESVCGISKANAISLCEKYLALDATIRSIYVDCTYINTYKKDGTAGTENVSYADVMVQLAIIGEVNLNSSTSMNPLNASMNTAYIVIIAVALSVSLIGFVFILKRKQR